MYIVRLGASETLLCRLHTSKIAQRALLVVSAGLQHDILNLRDALLRHFLPLVEVLLTITVLQETPQVLHLPHHTPILTALTTFHAFVNQERKFDGRAAEALGLKLMPKLILNANAILDDVDRDFNLNLDTD